MTFLFWSKSCRHIGFFFKQSKPYLYTGPSRHRVNLGILLITEILKDFFLNITYVKSDNFFYLLFIFNMQKFLAIRSNKLFALIKCVLTLCGCLSFVSENTGGHPMIQTSKQWYHLCYCFVITNLPCEVWNNLPCDAK